MTSSPGIQLMGVVMRFLSPLGCVSFLKLVIKSWEKGVWREKNVRLEGVKDTEDLGGVAAGGGGVRQDSADSLLWVNDEDGADSESNALGIDVGSILVIKHVIRKGDLALLITNDGEGQLGAGDLIDILDPAAVGLDGVGGEADELSAALGELGLELGEGAELGGAHGGVVLWVREEDHPLVADELVEVDVAAGGLGLEVGGDGAQAEAAWGG